MSDISVFFAQNAPIETNVEYMVSDRFKGKDGKPVPWILRCMTEDENETIRKAATKRERGKNGIVTQETNQNEYMAKLVVASVVFPNLKDESLQKSYGVMGAEALLKKMLLSGEYTTLIMKIQEINGFDTDMNELVDEAKNCSTEDMTQKDNA
ncbi:phage tail assembly chaperone [Paenibacillus sp. YYML68]|uniref:phage tail assembly chaperone n=1 Tax=Paenibacillus sp. YYML68 TaxID=2909250 RepID=UPI0024904955|nr:phage portal protein [Paenibacillus sp. YYML68]